MRLRRARDGDARSLALTRQPRLRALRPASRRAWRQVLRRSPGFRGHRLERRKPFRTPGKIDKPLRQAGLWRADGDQKSPVRRCFKSRPPLGGVRRFASGCRSFSGRLTGLLSRSPPTDTRPQARAYWARREMGRIIRNCKWFFAAAIGFAASRKRHVWRFRDTPDAAARPGRANRRRFRLGRARTKR
jgi:hypothetical protein